MFFSCTASSDPILINAVYPLFSDMVPYVLMQFVNVPDQITLLHFL